MRALVISGYREAEDNARCLTHEAAEQDRDKNGFRTFTVSCYERTITRGIILLSTMPPTINKEQVLSHIIPQ